MAIEASILASAIKRKIGENETWLTTFIIAVTCI
jgi:hypothetical protein